MEGEGEIGMMKWCFVYKNMHANKTMYKPSRTSLALARIFWGSFRLTYLAFNIGQGEEGHVDELGCTACIE